MIEAPLPLDAFCTELRRLAASIDAPKDYGPRCGGEHTGGLYVGLSSDGSKYRLIYTEKDYTDVIIESTDKDSVMEQVFVNVTGNMASYMIAENSDPITPESAFDIPSDFSDAEIERRAVLNHIRLSEAQEALLGRLNPEWQKRQKQRNATLLVQIKNNFKR
ncbi:hypothetical protein [Asticcacaulis excentricus]|uniref:hypothetical protein n=1 Tax=Asticcacaulis excentricus TaxID=78587 RepID=UPI000F81AA50|nr:hypothetical protein [Asticcacaulis excentricus]